MERKRNSGFCRIFTIAFDILGQLNVTDFPAWLEPPSGTRNRRKATVNIRRNPLLRFLSMIHINRIKKVLKDLFFTNFLS